MLSCHRHGRSTDSLFKDIVSLIVQGAGGGIAASAADGDVDATKLGGNVMLAGISFQLGELRRHKPSISLTPLEP